MSSHDQQPDPDSFPRRYARTQRFSLGVPRNISVSADGDRVVYLRSSGGEDPVNRLWVLDRSTASTGTEPRLIVDPNALAQNDDADLPAAERARRERLRESAAGVVSYSVDSGFATAAFALAGTLLVADLDSGDVRSLDTGPAVFGPRIDPTGRLVAYVSGNHLRLINPVSYTHLTLPTICSV